MKVLLPWMPRLLWYRMSLMAKVTLCSWLGPYLKPTFSYLIRGPESISNIVYTIPRLQKLIPLCLHFVVRSLIIGALSWRRCLSVPKNIGMQKYLPICQVFELVPT